MENNALGGAIARCRKSAGLTQEELGAAVGVSAQAVSRWECGGAPDISLLPAVADALGVSIDSLFGREPGERIDIKEAVRRWLASMPQSQRMDQLCELVWSAAPLTAVPSDYADNTEFLPSRRDRNSQGVRQGIPALNDGKTERWMRRIRVIGEEGLIFGQRADDLSWVGIFPEPEAGWEPFLEDGVYYQDLFALLARPHCVELLEYLNSKPPFTGRRHTPEAVAAWLGLELAETEALLDALAEMRLLSRSELELKEGLINCYALSAPAAMLVPFLCISLWLIARDGGNNNLEARETPILRGEKWKEKEN